MPTHTFDVIIIGAGHAGVEAAMAAARSGARTLLLTQSLDTLGKMSCNPSIGGIGKGHLVKEIDALGGIMAWAADCAGIHFRRLNASKGPAVWATRVQTDRQLYRQAIVHAVESQKNLYLFEQAVDDLIVRYTGQATCIHGVKTQVGITFYASAVVLTAGTFLNGKIHIGLEQNSAGRAGEAASLPLAACLKAFDLPQGRLKTGTPPRIDGRTIDFSQLEEQAGDTPRPVFSFLGKETQHPQQISCWITETNPQTHQIIYAGLTQSPLYTGVIQSVGPRYCPSIEDKIHRFSHKSSHQIFLEPEGLNTYEFYPNGIATSLSFDTQLALIHSIKGLEHAHIMRAGYAIEYDYFDPRALSASLQTKAIDGLFFAGQINGTTGYEEAAAQGLIAGINAARYAQELSFLVLRRDQAYIGVLIDDLITRGVSEPYRMFTSRAEYRLSLREDNADARLTAIGREFGLVDDQRWQFFCRKQKLVSRETQRLCTTYITPDTFPKTRAQDLFDKAIDYNVTWADLLRRPECNYQKLIELTQPLSVLDTDLVLAQQAVTQIEANIKYQGYIDRQAEEIKRQMRYEDWVLPKAFDYQQVTGLSFEVKQKLKEHRPDTLGQASRISGVTPAAVSLLLVYLKKHTQLSAHT